MLQIKVEGGFLNVNVQGESGYVSFPIIELRIKNTVVLPKTGLNLCSVNVHRANMVIGSCTNFWAQSIQTKKLVD